MTYDKQLLTIMRATGWSQERLASNLDITFATLNSWINRRSTPRTKALAKINNLYLYIVGADSVDQKRLTVEKGMAERLTMSAQKLVSHSELLDKLTLHLTYHSNTIEGSTMTLGDVKDVLFDNKVLANRTAIEQAEARNHQAALHWLIDELVQNNELKIDAALILNIHLRLMNGIISDAGLFRRHTVRIMASQVPLANWQKIPELINSLAEDVNRSEVDIIKELAQSHAVFEQIHPFSDANGRTGRLIMLVQALRAGLVPPLIENERKYAYYKYLELAQLKFDYRALELMIAESMRSANKLLGT